MFGVAGHTGLVAYDWDGTGQTDPPDPPDSSEELLGAGRPLPAWVRPGAIGLTTLLGVLVAVHVIVRVVGSNGTATSGAPAHRLPRVAANDPVQVCDDGLGPVVDAATAGPRTGLRLLVGGEGLQRVDFDTGASTPIRLPRLARDEWVDALSVVRGHEYAATAGVSCGLDRRRVVAIHGNDATHTVTVATPSDFVSDETHAWTIVDPGHQLTPLAGGRRVALPAGFAPAAATDAVIVGNLTQGMDPAEIRAVRSSNGTLLPTRGVGLVLGAAHGRYVWSAGCGPTTHGRCELDSAAVSGKRLRTYRVPRPPGSPTGLLSPDGRVSRVHAHPPGASGPAVPAERCRAAAPADRSADDGPRTRSARSLPAAIRLRPVRQLAGDRGERHQAGSSVRLAAGFAATARVAAARTGEPGRPAGAGARGGDRVNNDAFGDIDEPEELLGGGRPLPRWVRVAGGVLAVAVVGVLAVRALDRGNGGSHPAALSDSQTKPPSTSHSPQIAPPLFRQPGGPRILPAWPTAQGACDNQPQVALVFGQQRAHGTGLHLLVGGTRVWRVDFDRGTQSPVRTPALGGRAYIQQIAGSTAVVYDCRTSLTRTLTLGSDRPAVSNVGPVDVYQDGRRTYVVREATARHPQPLLSTPGRPSVQLPRHYTVTGITDGVVAGSALLGGEYVGMLLDAGTGRITTRLIRGQPVAAGGGVVISQAACDVGRRAPCTLRSTSVSDGATHSYRIPRSPGIVPGVLSPDGREYAFLLERSRPDRHYSMGYPIPPADIAWLHLDTGRLDVAPGIELPGKVALSLAFAPRSDWVVVALDQGVATRLVAWHPGLAKLQEAAPIVAPASSQAGLEVIAG